MYSELWDACNFPKGMVKVSIELNGIGYIEEKLVEFRHKEERLASQRKCRPGDTWEEFVSYMSQFKS